MVARIGFLGINEIDHGLKCFLRRICNVNTAIVFQPSIEPFLKNIASHSKNTLVSSDFFNVSGTIINFLLELEFDIGGNAKPCCETLLQTFQNGIHTENSTIISCRSESS